MVPAAAPGAAHATAVAPALFGNKIKLERKHAYLHETFLAMLEAVHATDKDAILNI